MKLWNSRADQAKRGIAHRTLIKRIAKQDAVTRLILGIAIAPDVARISTILPHAQTKI